MSIFSGTTGYILSLDWFGLFYRDHQGSEVVQPNQTKSFKSRSRSQKMVQSNGFLIGKEILTHIVFFCINLAVIMVYTPDFESPGSSQILPHTNNSTLNNNANITTGKLLILIYRLLFYKLYLLNSDSKIDKFSLKSRNFNFLA